MTVSPEPRWLILADDLTGASDCAVAFTQAGLPASVVWGEEAAESRVISVDTDSRRLKAAAAAARLRAALSARLAEDMLVFKKIDSTLRGQPGAELAGAIRVLRERGHRALCIFAPSFPATGRTVLHGRALLHGAPLEQSPLWLRDHSYPEADLVAILRSAGLVVRYAALNIVRAGQASLQDSFSAALAEGADVVICDSGDTQDLAIIAASSLPWAADLLWCGSAGLAHALAQACGTEQTWAGEPLESRGGILLAVGSVAEASRAAARVIAADPDVLPIRLDVAQLRAEGPDAAALGLTIAEALRSGRDVLVTLGGDGAADLSVGAELAAGLARLLSPAAPHAGAIFATGGETARFILTAFGVTSIRLIAEIEPGVPLGVTQGAVTLPVVTKAGAFGDAGTMHRCLSHLRRLRVPGEIV
jgi:uncharacterized protein YgbK (DUF1537 family)